MLTQAPRGTKDWYGRDIELRNKIMDLARRIATKYNFNEISTPAFEHTTLFNRGIGGDTDVVQKEMYTFTDKGGREISLKPEGTAPVIRAYLEHNMYAEPAPTKLFYFTQAFRYEKPASGRLRQHHQFGCELIGSVSPLAEIEIISLVYEFIKELGLKDVKLHINSIGQGQCRKDYTENLKNYLKQYKSELCPTCLERMEKNPLRVIDCKVEGCKAIVKNAPKIMDFLDEDCRAHMDEIENLLKIRNIPYVIDSGVVRGLDYYTKTVFEFIDSDGFTLCGGGRYDNLVKEIDGKQDIPSVGFGIGIERILYFLEKENIDMPVDTSPQVYIGNIGNKVEAYNFAMRLREAGFNVEIDLMDRSVKAQMKYANKIGAKFTIIVGDEEIKNQECVVKNMVTGEQISCSFDKVKEVISHE